MTMTKGLIALLGGAALLACAGCGASNPPRTEPSYVVGRVPGTHQWQIVLTPDGAGAIGIQTARAASVRGRRASVTIPLSAIIYSATGETYAYVSPRRLAYRQVAIRVRTIVGRTVYLRSGVPPGSRVVTVGAEELFGAQTG